MKRYIYGLQDPRDNLFYYVGASINPQRRLRAHISDAKSNLTMNLNLTVWILRLLLVGKEPLLVVFEEVDEENWKRKERLWINKLRKEKQPICNKCKGGEGGSNNPKLERTIVISLRGSHSTLINRLIDDCGETESELIAEAIENYWGKHDAGRTESFAGASQDDAGGDGSLLGIEAPFASDTSGSGANED